MSSNGLKDTERDVRTMRMTEVVGSCQLLKIWEQLQNFVVLVACNHQMTLKLMVNHLHIKMEQSIRFFMKIWKRGKSTPSLFHTVSPISRRSTESQLCKLHHGKLDISHPP
jgi:hypothetical protein